MDVGPPRSPQRPNERHRGCGGRRTASAAAASIPPVAPRGPGATAFPPPPSLPGTKRASVRSSDLAGWPGVSGQRAPRGTVLAFPPGSGWGIFCGRGGLRCRGAAAPRRGPEEVPRVPSAGRARSCPAAGIRPSARRAGTRPRRGILTQRRLPESGKGGGRWEGGDPFSGGRRGSLLRVGFPEEGR